MSALASLPNLRFLDLAHNQLGAAGSKALSEVLIPNLLLLCSCVPNVFLMSQGSKALSEVLISVYCVYYIMINYTLTRY